MAALCHFAHQKTLSPSPIGCKQVLKNKDTIDPTSMTKDKYNTDENFINEIATSTLSVIAKIEEDVKNGVSIEGSQMELTKKWKEICSYFKASISDSESEIRVLPKKKHKSDFLTANMLLHHFLSIDKTLAKTYLEELWAQNRFGEPELRRLRNLESYYLENEEIVQGIRQGIFGPIEAFVAENPEYFLSNTRTSFGIVALKFLTLALQRERGDAIKLLYREMVKFSTSSEYREEVREILMYLVRDVGEGVLKAYTDMVAATAHRDHCTIRDIPVRPFLETLFHTGSKAIPVLLEASKTFKDVDMEKFADVEVVVKLPRGSERAFHSLFVCPVLKCVCDADNLPVLLECGHVISQNAITQISNSGSKQVFKCPYCPTECSFHKSRMLFLKS